jgi:hypothetical protein
MNNDLILKKGDPLAHYNDYVKSMYER